jgi:hypothetical protein
VSLEVAGIALYVAMGLAFFVAHREGVRIRGAKPPVLTSVLVSALWWVYLPLVIRFFLKRRK